jgi:nucleoid DNA-binding protein
MLGIDVERARRLLDRFSEALTASLLEGGRLSVDGLGQFSVVHKEPVRESTPEGMRYLPPRKTISFDYRPRLQGEVATIAVTRLDMDAAEARGFAQALTRLFAELGKRQGQLVLRGFGVLTAASGGFRFQSDPSLEELLNIAYGGLPSIDIRPAQKSGDVHVSSGHPEGLKKIAVLVVVLFLSVGGWMFYRQLSPAGSVLPTGKPVDHSMIVSGRVMLPDKVGQSVTQGASSAQADSVLLRRGRYTVIVATFNTKKVARREMQRLSEPGYRVMIWPVRQDGVRYFRLVLGDFGTFREALDSMKVMPGELSGNSYIQQAPKNVFIYGEKGL